MKKHLLWQLSLLLFAFQITSTGQPVFKWDKNFGNDVRNGMGITGCSRVARTTDGNFLILSQSSEEAGEDKSNAGAGAWLIKITQDGIRIWDKTFRYTNASSVGDIIATPDGGSVMAVASYNTKGSTASEPGRGDHDYWIVKMSANGNIEWDRTLGGSLEDVVTSVIPTRDGGYIAAGYSASGATGDRTSGSRGGRDLWVVKLSASGQLEWDKSYGTSGNEDYAIIRPAQNGGYLISSRSEAPADGDKTKVKGGLDFWTIRIDSVGNKLWEKTYGGTEMEYLSEVLPESDGSFVLVGFSYSNAGFDKTEDRKGGIATDGWMIKIDSLGQVLWDKTLGGAKADEITYIEKTADGGYLISATSLSDAGYDKSENQKTYDDSDIQGDFWLIKLNARGNKIWDKTTGGDGGDGPRYGSETSRGNYVMIGSSNSNLFYARGDRSMWRKGRFDVWMAYLEEDQPALPQTTLRINAGGPDFTTATKKLFIGDKYYSGVDRTSSITSGDILNTTNDALYQSARCSPSFNYNIPVRNGQVNVTLHFAETYFGAPGKKGGAGSRRFNVNIEGVRQLTNYDIFSAAGGAMRAVQLTISVIVTDGVLNIDFLTGAADLPKVCAIEVIATSTTLSPVADAYVREGSYGSSNFGLFGNLEIKNFSGDPAVRRSSYLRFQLPASTTVGSAKLRIYGHNHENTKAISLHAYGIDNDNWTEVGITKSNAPGASTSSLGFTTITDAYKYYEIDVTSYVKAQQQSGEKLVSLLLSDPNNRNTRIILNSREASANPPQLVIQATNSAARLGLEEVLSEVQEKQPSIIYPNPVKDHFTISLSPEHAGAISFEMINAAGKSLTIPVPQNVKPGENTRLDIAGQSFNLGIYLLKVESDTFTEAIKLIIIK
ncbi:CBM96 family carbohydrate-binding protein [Dyadobacter sandarakinus]|uniref:DNRLRE domain-containing protein n=1 Tax=Dyadobacter sandarakinus TaxID=2747268 RepID=A0ABX7I2Z6_9BACT|nr:malectin domain-containing carbohydrate-binding protein [Dyadobacter sandarakinus]QRR00160.1 DNRLRE domain-containing protein [Dyadobacter sandarakinus]